MKGVKLNPVLRSCPIVAGSLLSTTTTTVQRATIDVSVFLQPCRTSLFPFFRVCVGNATPTWIVGGGVGMENEGEH